MAERETFDADFIIGLKEWRVMEREGWRLTGNAQGDPAEWPEDLRIQEFPNHEKLE